MNKFITLALALCATVASSYGNIYGSPPPSGYGGPAVQQVSSLAGLPNIEQILGGAAGGYSSGPSSYGSTQYAPLKAVVLPAPAPAPAYSSASAAAPAAGYGASPGYGVSPSYAPAPPLPSYSSAPSAGYAVVPAPSSSYGAAPSSGYGAPKVSVQPAYATQLYPGQQNYKTIQSPPQYSTVALPIVPSDPVAKLYIPEQSYGSNSAYAPSVPY